MSVTKATVSFPYGGKRYSPLLVDGKMDLRTAVAYGPAGQRKFMLTVYAMSVLAGAKDFNNFFDIPLWREMLDQGITEAQQVEQLEFMCNVCATKAGLDYELRMRHDPKKTPKSYYKVSKPITQSPRELARIIDFANQIDKEKRNGI